jgi:uncharacterized LabA/DUF88 family protein
MLSLAGLNPGYLNTQGLSRGGTVAVRVATYIDGFNLYNGLKEKHGRKYLWLDLQGLAASLLLPDQKLVAVSYFSARVRQEASSHRQATYIDALKAACPLLSVVEGRFQEKHLECRVCGHRRVSYEEKETDVSIAVALVEDAACDRYDTAMIISADSDLCPAVRAVRRIAPAKRVVAAFPPRRVSGELRRTAHGTFTIPDSKIRRNRLPDDVTGEGGIVLSRPPYWS